MADDSEEEFDVEVARDCLLEEIVGCYNCQPWEQGPVWLGPHVDLEDLLNDCGIEEEHWEEVLEDLQCPSCGTPLTELGDEVEVKSEYDKQVEAILEKAKSVAIIQKLKAFNSHLKEYPYLGLCDPQGTGSEILSKIQGRRGYKLRPREWYRARRINEESRIFASEEMGAPDPRKVYIREGRYNHTGQVFLYLANSPEVAFKEIKSEKQNLCAIQKYKISEDLSVLDLRQDYSDIDIRVDLLVLAIIYNGFIYRKPLEESSWKPEYFIPRFISDCARKEGYDGILFSTVFGYGENLAVFPHKIDKFTAEGECIPFRYEEKPPKSVFLDLRTMYNPLIDDEDSEEI